MEQLKQVKGLIYWFFNQFPDSVLIAMTVMGLGCGVLFCLHLIGSREVTVPNSPQVSPTGYAESNSSYAYQHAYQQQFDSEPVPVYDQDYVRSRFGSPNQNQDHGFMAGRACAFN
ncbi:MAG: hypothetical protein K8F91_13190 [Candidatus Obscuribacterales bacterium]|nr:hypothetical protein [Candidatus Obscuribacterales bacterium]